MAFVKSAWPEGHPEIREDRVGVLLINLGTPDGADYWSMRRYLKQFLSDRRVIEVNPILWSIILNGFILTFRPWRSGRAYNRIWNHERNESPLRTITRTQGDALGARFGDANVVVDWAMRYGTPSIRSRLEVLADQGCRRIILFPLYPHYSAATTATACDDAFDALKAMRWQPSVRVVPPYFDEDLYVEALAESLTRHLGQLDWRPEMVLASYHGLPKSYFEKGDPYHCHCAKTTRLLWERLGWSDVKLRLCFQSRFGSKEWLKPYTDETLQELAAAGIKRVAILAPGFSADCLETLDELANKNHALFLDAGGERFSYAPCLNDDDRHMDFLAALVRREGAGWIAETKG